MTARGGSCLSHNGVNELSGLLRARSSNKDGSAPTVTLAGLVLAKSVCTRLICSDAILK